MKNNRITILIAALLLLVIFVWLLIFKRSSQSSYLPTVAIAKQSTTNLPRESPLDSGLGNYPSYVSNGNTYMVVPSNIVEAVRRRDEERAKEDSGRWWRTPISFYGRIVDQYGNPLADADVRFTVTDLSLQGSSEYHTKSDPNGFFSLSGIRGRHLMVYFSKEGYYQSATEGNAFDYNDIASGNQYKPDRSHPEVFHLHRGGEKVALIKRDMNVRVQLGETVVVDLLNGKTNSPNGQLRIELLENDRGGRNGFGSKCSMRLSVLDGGIQPYTEEFPFVAPETGYESSVQIGSEFGNPPPGWGTRTARAFFLHAQGLYARVLVEMNPGGSLLGLDYYVNPTGSRNLEPGHLYENIDIYNRYAPKQKQATK